MPSKSSAKREFLAFQALARELIATQDSTFDRLPLSSELREQIALTRPMRKGALSRQLRYLGKLISLEQPDAIRHALDQARHAHDLNTRAFRELERWRDDLISGDKATLEEVIERFDNADAQHLRQLVRNAQRERERDKPPSSARALFRYLSELRNADGS